jgi:FSR family fosmidomycin resistance protein-like MFS transporter
MLILFLALNLALRRINIWGGDAIMTGEGPSRERIDILQLFLIFLIGFGHLVTEFSGGALPMLFPVLKTDFHLSYTAVGAIVQVYILSATITQPLFGIWSDRISSRWLLATSCFLAALGLAIVGWAGSFAMVLLGVLINGLGTAAFHPEASKQAFLASDHGKAMFSLSIFSVGGNLGYGLGPLAATLLLAGGGRRGIAVLLLPAAATALLLQLYQPTLARFNSRPEATTNNRSAAPGANNGAAWYILALLVIYVIFRSWISFGVTTFMPLYFVNYLKGDPGYAGIWLTVFLLAGAVGTLAGAPWAERIGKKATLGLSFIALIPPFLLFPYASGIWNLILAGWAGFFLYLSTAIAIVYAQEVMPHRVGLAASLMMGLGVGLGGLGTLLMGRIADLHGVPAALAIMAALVPPTLLITLLLPGEKGTARMLHFAQDKVN